MRAETCIFCCIGTASIRSQMIKKKNPTAFILAAGSRKTKRRLMPLDADSCKPGMLRRHSGCPPTGSSDEILHSSPRFITRRPPATSGTTKCRLTRLAPERYLVGRVSLLLL
ncbi:hypothetical protein OJAV_G00041280 [Oryzias javanicus]|uniref:Uncharacterized protein n=1 Tax=Oryzias javanicus TaxID=123683 RepID=A0A437DD55_ORYJA|nr:hypothetical protein OJAV_G00041280 [Oryzias javanicus]